MTPGTNDEILIETPCGVIRIAWDVVRRRKRLAIDVPDCMAARKNLNRLHERLEWLEVREDGSYAPKWSLLKPVVDRDGRIIGLRKPTIFAIGPRRSGKERDEGHEGNGEQADAQSVEHESQLENVATAGTG